MVCDESKDAVIAVPSIGPEEALGSPTFRMSTPFWLYWSEIAIESEHSARLHRMAAHTENPDKAMIEETKASMVALTACAHALDAVCLKFADRCVPPGQLETRKERRGGHGSKRGLKARGYGFKVKTDDWRGRIVWLFEERRNPALHYSEKTKEVVEHPLGTHTAPEMVDYSVEESSRAVDLLLDVFDQCSAAPKPAAANKANSKRHQVEGLSQLRERLRTET